MYFNQTSAYLLAKPPLSTVEKCGARNSFGTHSMAAIWTWRAPLGAAVWRTWTERRRRGRSDFGTKKQLSEAKFGWTFQQPRNFQKPFFLTSRPRPLMKVYRIQVDAKSDSSLKQTKMSLTGARAEGRGGSEARRPQKRDAEATGPGRWLWDRSRGFEVYIYIDRYIYIYTMIYKCTETVLKMLIRQSLQYI